MIMQFLFTLSLVVTEVYSLVISNARGSVFKGSSRIFILEAYARSGCASTAIYFYSHRTSAKVMVPPNAYESVLNPSMCTTGSLQLTAHRFPATEVCIDMIT